MESKDKIFALGIVNAVLGSLWSFSVIWMHLLWLNALILLTPNLILLIVGLFGIKEKTSLTVQYVILPIVLIIDFIIFILFL